MSRVRYAMATARRLFSRPRRGALWQCSKCSTWNEPDRTSCMNGCR